MTITAAMVKTLRERTGAGMLDCKTALTESGGDMEAAIDWLRTKGLAAAAKKAGRAASDGLVAIASGQGEGAIIELNSETDFVARNEQFQNLVRNIATLGLQASGTLETLKATAFVSDKTVDEAIAQLIGTIGENMALRRYNKISVDSGIVAGYMHGQIASDLGKIGVLVGIKSTGDLEQLNLLGRKIAMHIAATNPLAVRSEDISQEAVDRERAIFVSQARESGKPDSIIEKMVEGRLRKFFQEATLMHQPFVMEPDITVQDFVDRTAKDLGTEIAITEFVRFGLGEEMEGQGAGQEADAAAKTA